MSLLTYFDTSWVSIAKITLGDHPLGFVEENRSKRTCNHTFSAPDASGLLHQHSVGLSAPVDCGRGADSLARRILTVITYHWHIDTECLYLEPG